MKKKWQILAPDRERVEHLIRRVNCLPEIAAILANRQLCDPVKALAFLNPTMQHLRAPFSIKDMDAGVQRIARAITANEKILVFGDYDVDGITAATLIFQFLKIAGAAVSVYIPHRLKEGYDLQLSHVETVALPRKIELIITTDCGSSSHAALQRAALTGIDVVVTDHHKLSETLPQAVAVINPQRPDCNAGFEHLAGVGVAMALAICLRKHLRESGHWTGGTEPNLKEFCDLVALGTIADSVPLVDENRILVRTGLDLIRKHCPRPGIKELLRTSRTDAQNVTSDDLAYQVVPRMNAAGRIDHAELALQLLTATDYESAGRLAATLDQLNRQRKDIEKNITEEIRKRISATPGLEAAAAIVFAGDRWHEGVLGIVASRVVEWLHRPVVLLSTRDGVCKGSARSIPGVNVHHCLTECADLLDSFGGHSMAAGLRLKSGDLEQFAQTFEAAVKSHTLGRISAPDLRIDAELNLTSITDELVDAIESLHPFGNGNPEPLFVSRNVQVRSSRIVGRHHRSMLLFQRSQESDRNLTAIYFNVDPQKCSMDFFKEIVYHIRWNRWNGRRNAQLVVVDAI